MKNVKGRGVHRANGWQGPSKLFQKRIRRGGNGQRQKSVGNQETTQAKKPGIIKGLVIPKTVLFKSFKGFLWQVRKRGNTYCKQACSGCGKFLGGKGGNPQGRELQKRGQLYNGREVEKKENYGELTTKGTRWAQAECKHRVGPNVPLPGGKKNEDCRLQKKKHDKT